MRGIVILFARVPRLGAVKRRLAAGIGDREAYRFHKTLLARLLRQLSRERRFRAVAALTPDHARLRLPGRLRRIAQGQGDLGARMARAFRRFPRARVVLVGCDVPAIAMSDLAAGLRALRTADAVFGPATDGGYWLAGMSTRRPARPFAGVRWSTGFALADTMRHFQHRRTIRLRLLSDVDCEQDYRRWLALGKKL